MGSSARQLIFYSLKPVDSDRKWQLIFHPFWVARAILPPFRLITVLAHPCILPSRPTFDVNDYHNNWKSRLEIRNVCCVCVCVAVCGWCGWVVCAVGCLRLVWGCMSVCAARINKFRLGADQKFLGNSRKKVKIIKTHDVMHISRTQRSTLQP